MSCWVPVLPAAGNGKSDSARRAVPWRSTPFKMSVVVSAVASSNTCSGDASWVYSRVAIGACRPIPRSTARGARRCWRASGRRRPCRAGSSRWRPWQSSRTAGSARDPPPAGRGTGSCERAIRYVVSTTRFSPDDLRQAGIRAVQRQPGGLVERCRAGRRRRLRRGTGSSDRLGSAAGIHDARRSCRSAERPPGSPQEG